MASLGTPSTPIRPSGINAQRHFWDAFNHNETEISAGWIVRFCQSRNNDTWAPFRLADLHAYYVERRGRQETFLFNRLVSSGYVSVDSGVVSVSVQFVAKCYAASPAA